MEYGNGGQYELDLDFIEIPAEGFPPDCNTRSYAKTMITGDKWTPPPAPSEDIPWEVDFGLIATKRTGFGSIPEIVIDSTVEGYEPEDTGNGCPIFVVARYLCPDHEIVVSDFVSDGIARNDFIQIMTLSKSSSQASILDALKLLVDIPPDTTVTDFGSFYDQVQAFFLANPDTILDVSGIKLTTMDLINTLTNVKKLNASHNNLTRNVLNYMFRLELNYLDFSFNWFAGDIKELKFMRPSLKYIDFSYNYLTSLYFYDSLNAGSPWEVDLFDISFNNIAESDQSKARYKKYIMTDNVFPTVPFWMQTYDFFTNEYLTIHIGDYMENIELIDFSNTKLAGSFYDLDIDPNKHSPDKEVALLLARIVADGHTQEYAQSVVIRNPKWETLQVENKPIYTFIPNQSLGGVTPSSSIAYSYGYWVAPFYSRDYGDENHPVMFDYNGNRIGTASSGYSLNGNNVGLPNVGTPSVASSG